MLWVRPSSKTLTTCGCVSLPALLISRSNRSISCADIDAISVTILSATSRLKISSRASHTAAPMPPRPISRSIVYLPILCPERGSRSMDGSSSHSTPFAPASSSDSTSPRSPQSFPHTSSSNPVRCSSGRSMQRSSTLRTSCQRGSDISQLPGQPGARDLPPAHDGAQRNVEDAGRVGNRVAREEAHLDDLHELGIELLQPLQRLVQREQVRPAHAERMVPLVDGNVVARALFGFPESHAVDDDLSHRARRRGQEVGPVHPVVRIVAKQLEIDLVDQTGRTEQAGVRREDGTGHRSQLAIHDVEELRLGRILAALEACEDPIDVDSVHTLPRGGPRDPGPSLGIPLKRRENQSRTN